MIQNTPTCYQIIQMLKYLALSAKLIAYLATNDAGSFSSASSQGNDFVTFLT